MAACLDEMTSWGWTPLALPWLDGWTEGWDLLSFVLPAGRSVMYTQMLFAVSFCLLEGWVMRYDMRYDYRLGLGARGFLSDRECGVRGEYNCSRRFYMCFIGVLVMRSVWKSL